MSIKFIADTLIAHCKNGTEFEGLDTLYAENAVSVEAHADPQIGDAIFTGIEAIKGKHEWWNANNTVHQQEIEGPYILRDQSFALKFSMDVTDKNNGQRTQMSEIAVYHVENDKIVREEFYY